MKCPHCQTSIHPEPHTFPIGKDRDGFWAVIKVMCPACKRIVLSIVCGRDIGITAPAAGEHVRNIVKSFLGYPRAASRPAPPPEVPREFAEDYVEASLVLADSPKASAALTRRCLQHLLRERAGVKPMDLAKEIQQVLDENLLPSYLSETLDAVRHIGNFAAHPIKSTTTGEVVPVERGEAEWNLDVLDGLFDFFFVQPALIEKRREALNAKLAEAGKPLVKQG